MDSTPPPIVVVGCGNLNRSDDGVGVRCAQALQEELRDEIQQGWVAVFDAGTGGFDVMYRMRGAQTLIVIDACVSHSEPGAVFEVPGEEVELEADPGMNLHAFRWDHALWASKKILKDAFPSDVVVFLVEAASTELGLELTPAVQASIDHVVSRISRRIRPTAETRNGNLYLDRAVIDRFLAGVHTVAVVATPDGELCIMPIKGAGGLLLKQRNARGDGVVAAIELLRRLDLENAELSLRPDASLGGLIASPVRDGPSRESDALRHHPKDAK